MSDKTELDLLRERADQMGIKYDGRTGVETLRERIDAVLGNTPAEPTKTKNAMSARQQAYNEAMKLVRIRLSCMDPAKNEHPGEMVTICNDVVGDIKKYIPYKEEFYENGYHVPNIVYLFLKERRYAAIKSTNGPKGIQVSHVMAPVYNIEVLPQLTPDELEALKAQQAASKSID